MKDKNLPISSFRYDHVGQLFNDFIISKGGNIFCLFITKLSNHTGINILFFF